MLFRSLRPLASCVRFLNGFTSAPAGLLPKLHNCYLVADSGAGRTLAAQFPDKYFLTSDGVWFQGAVVFAGRTDSQGPLALKRELRSLEREVENHVEAETRLAAQLKAALENIERKQTELTDVGLKERESERVLMHAERDLREAAEEESRVANRSELIGLELDRLRGELERARVQLATDGEMITEREQTRAALEAENATIVGESAQLRQKLEEARSLEADLRGRLAALEERRRASAATVERLDGSLREVTARREEITRQREAWAVQRTEIEAGNRQLQEEIAQAEQRCEILGKHIEELQMVSVQLREQIAGMDQQLHDARAAVEVTREKRNEAEVHMARLQSELDHLKETCHNELQIEMEVLCFEAANENMVLLQAEELAAADENWRQMKTRLENMEIGRAHV